MKNPAATQTLKQTILSFIVCFLFAALGQNTWAANTSYSGGDGSAQTPYQIATLNDLKYLSQHPEDWGKQFVQTANIEAGSSTQWQDGKGFCPIGNQNTSFSGVYDGDMYIINGLYINRPSTPFIGLFGYIESATLKNIYIENANYKGKTLVGGIAGKVLNAQLENCYSAGKLYGGNQTGGLLGYSINSKIISSYSACQVVSGQEYAGGLVALITQNTRIENCYSTGEVSSKACFAGGLVGKAEASTISRSYSTSKVSGLHRVGGLVGSCYQGSQIRNCYSMGSVNSQQNYQSKAAVGGFCGSAYSSTISQSYTTSSVYFADKTTATNKGFLGGAFLKTSVQNTYFDKTVSNQTDDAYAQAHSTAQLKQKDSFSAWDFDTVWMINPDINQGYPTFGWPQMTDNEITSYASEPTQQLNQVTKIISPQSATNQPSANYGELICNITVSGNGLTDGMHLSSAPGATLGYDAHLDQLKLSASKRDLLIYCLENGQKMEVNKLSLEKDGISVNVMVYTAKAGSYTLEIPSLLPFGIKTFVEDFDSGEIVKTNTFKFEGQKKTVQHLVLHFKLVKDALAVM